MDAAEKPDFENIAEIPPEALAAFSVFWKTALVVAEKLPTNNFEKRLQWRDEKIESLHNANIAFLDAMTVLDKSIEFLKADAVRKKEKYDAEIAALNGALSVSKKTIKYLERGLAKSGAECETLRAKVASLQPKE